MSHDTADAEQRAAFQLVADGGYRAVIDIAPFRSEIDIVGRMDI